MPIFQTRPNLPDGEKARIEFHFQQLVEHLGNSRFLLPVASEDDILGPPSARRDIHDIRDYVGRHLNFDVNQIQIQHQPQLPVKKSGGGG